MIYVNNHTHNYTNKYLFNEVADFNDIVEKESDDTQINLEERTPEAENENHVPISSSFSTSALPFSKSPLRHKNKTHDIKNRESDLNLNNKISENDDMSFLNDNFWIEPHLHKKRPKENVFEKPEVYMINNHSPQSGYYIVKEKQPRSGFKQLNDLVKKYKSSKHHNFDEANWKPMPDTAVKDEDAAVKDKGRFSDATIGKLLLVQFIN